MSALVRLADWADRSRLVQESVAAVREGAQWAWLVGGVAAAAVWVARGMPSPYTAAAAAAAIPIGAGLAAWRAWRRASARTSEVEECKAAAAASWRWWLSVYTLAAALIPAGYAAAQHGQWTPAAAAAAALVVLAVVTIPLRGRARLLARLRARAAAIAGDDDVRVSRALWRGRHLLRFHVTYPEDWAAHKPGKRDDLVEGMLWELCGPPPATPAAAIARPDYTSRFDHVAMRLEVERVPSLPRSLAARDWERPAGAIVLGQTLPDRADAVVDGVPVALYVPAAHLLVVGGTQHGKSSGVRAWAVDGLTHDVWPGGLWVIDGKGSGSMAALIGREGVHAVAHTPAEWRRVITELVAPEVARRYEEMLAWRSGQLDRQPRHPRGLLILDEIQQVLLACPDLADTLNTLARQALEAGIIMWVITQRPDAADAVPGAMRDQLLDRATFGPLSGSGARMSFDLAGDDWHRAMGVAPIAGRSLTWLGGVWRLVQAPWMPIPADDPSIEPLYPHKAAQGATEAAEADPDPDPDQGDTGGASGPEPTPLIPEVEQILRDYGPGGGAKGKAGDSPAAYDPQDPYAHRRKRRRGRRRD